MINKKKEYVFFGDIYGGSVIALKRRGK